MEDWRIVVRQNGEPGGGQVPDGGDATATSTTTSNNNPGGGVRTTATEGVASQSSTATTTAGAANPSSSARIAKFNTDVFTGNVFTGYSRIFRADTIKANPISFGYSLDDTFKPVNVSLYLVDNTTDAETTIEGTQATGPFSFASGAVKFEYSKLLGGAAGANVKTSYDDMVLALDMHWISNNGSITGHTYSPYFGMLSDSALREGTQKLDTLQAEIVGFGTAAEGRDADVSTGAASATSTSTNTASGANPSSSSGGGGLGTGAIVGIAIGAAAGVAIIAALAWFLLRRRKNKAGSSPLAEGASNAYIADKDSTAQSPQSPYADDTIHNPRADSSSLHNTTHDNVPGGPRDGSGTATPSGLSRNVAHLVEEGMTADDIARLEEEERQLDDEIERAAGVASAAERR